MRDLIDQNAATLDFLKTFLDKTIAAPPVRATADGAAVGSDAQAQ